MRQFREKVIRACEQLGWNQARLASEVEVSPNTASRWVNGEVRPFRPEALRLARALRLSLDYLADDEMDEPATVPSLPPGDALVLEVFHALELDPHEAIRRLSLKSRMQAERPEGLVEPPDDRKPSH
jgi:transcriptional regulator with XRE-family HTH domain